MFGLSGDKQVVSLDWDSRFLRVVQWRISGHNARSLKSVAAELPEHVSVKDADSLGGFVRQVLSSARIRTTSAIVDIPRDQAVLNTMSLPAADLNDLAGMVQLQIAKELPFPLDDAVVDFAVTQQDSAANSADVLVAAVRFEVMGFYKSVCEQAGLKLDRVGLRPFANMVAVNEMLGAQASGRIMFVDVGPSLTEIGIIRDGVMVFSRAASVSLDEQPADDVADDFDDSLDTMLEEEPAADEHAAGAEAIEIDFPRAAQAPAKPSAEDRILNELMVEITRSAEAYRSTDPGARFDRIIVGGSSGFDDALAGKISKRFGVAAEAYDPDPILNPRHHQGAHAGAFAAAVGLGIGHASEDKLQFNFLTPKKPIGVAERRRRQMPLAGAIFAGVALIACLAYAILVMPKQKAVKDYKSQIAELKKELKSYAEVQRIVEQVEQWEQAQLVWPDELRQIAELFPENEVAYLEDLDLTASRGEISFRIAASNPEVVDELRAALNNLTRKGRQEDKNLSVFKVRYRNLSTTRSDDTYPAGAKMFVVSARVEDLLNKSKKSKKRG